MNTVRSVSHYALVAASLLGLLALTVSAAYCNLGWGNTPVAMLISGTKALIIVLFFMHARHASHPTLLYVVAGFLWLAILFALSLSDFLTRY